MRPLRWFLPETPDVLGMLRRQTAVTIDGMDALAAWAHGDRGAADRLRAEEHRADSCKRELRQALTVAFTTPLEPEDLFELSQGLDEVINRAKDTAREAELMRTDPDPPMAEMSERLAEGVRHLADAFEALEGGEEQRATDAADAAVKSQRRLERTYRTARSALIDLEDTRQVASRRELYRRLSRTSDQLVGVAERVWYAVLKKG